MSVTPRLSGQIYILFYFNKNVANFRQVLVWLHVTSENSNMSPDLDWFETALSPTMEVSKSLGLAYGEAKLERQGR